MFGSSDPLVPPVTRTLPSARIVAVWSLRPKAIDPVYFQAGVELFKSIISAVAVGSVVQVVEYAEHVLPPITSTLPSSYMTDEPQLRSPYRLFPTRLQAPVPETSRYRVVPLGPAMNTFPFGATCMKG